MTIWKKEPNIQTINHSLFTDTLMQSLGIELSEIGEDYLSGTMPVDTRTHQPMGFLHGGASVALAESLGSMAAWLTQPEGYYIFGTDIQASHVRPVRSGVVSGTARPLYLGSKKQIWDILISDESNNLICTARLTVAIRVEH